MSEHEATKKYRKKNSTLTGLIIILLIIIVVLLGYIVHLQKKTVKVTTALSSPQHQIAPVSTNTPQKADPFLTMQRQMSAMQQQMQQMMAQSMQQSQHMMPFSNVNAPHSSPTKIQLHDKGKYYLVTVTAPNINKQAINVHLNGQQLTISWRNRHADKQQNKQQQNYQQYESQVTESLLLPQAVNAKAMKTSYKGEQLMITVPKLAK